MNKVWNWLSGKKTIFGLIALQALHEGLFDEGTTAYTILKLVGWSLTAMGAGHKVYKGTGK